MYLTDILSLTVDGIALGAIYALVGISLNIAYKPTNVFNLAQGEFVMLGAMLSWLLISGVEVPWVLGAVLVLVVVGLLGLVEERIAVAPHFKADVHSHGWLISTLAVSVIIINVTDKIFRPEPQMVPPVPGTSTMTQSMGPVFFNTHQLAVIALVVAIILGLDWFYSKTLTGKSISAVSEDQDGARLNGINPLHITMLSFGAAAAVSAAAGLLAAPLMLASTSLGLALLVKGFMAMAVGGVGSNWGTFFGGLLVGVVESLGSLYFSTGTRQLLLLGILLAILLIRPQGFFGKAMGRAV